MSKAIQLAPGLTLPLDSILLKKAILAKQGAGKSTTAAAFVEDTLEAGVPVVILDPKGDWWGLRSSADGKKPGYPIIVMGGEEGDVPLEPGAGALVAKVVVESGASVVLDVSDFTKKQMIRFVGEFATAFYRAKKQRKEPCLFVIDEADEVAPQRAITAYGPDMGICLAAIEKIVKRGRFLGIGTLVITQRSASLNKDVLTQTDMLVVMQTTAPQDVKAVDDWISHHPDQEKRQEVLDSIQSLKVGEGYVWCPGLDLFKRTKFRRRRTFDAGQTPGFGKQVRAPQKRATIDLDKLRTQMSELIEQAKEDDPRALKARIQQLEAEARKKPAATKEVVEVSLLTAQDRDLLAQAAAGLGGVDQDLETRIASLEALQARLAAVRGGLRNMPQRPAAPATRPTAAPKARPVVQAVDVQLRAGARRMLEELANYYPGRVTRAQLGMMSNLRHTGGTFNTYLSDLRRGGFIEETGDELTATRAGLDAAGIDEPRPKTAAEILAMWRSKLRSGARKMLDHLVDQYPRLVEREDLAAAVGLEATGGTFNTYLSDLRRNGLIDEEDRQVRAADIVVIDMEAT